MDQRQLEEAMQAHVDAQLPRLQAVLGLMLAVGHSIEDLVGLVSDGCGVAARLGDLAVVVPREVLRRVTDSLGAERPDWAAQLEAPQPGLLPCVVFYQGTPGFALVIYEHRFGLVCRKAEA